MTTKSQSTPSKSNSHQKKLSSPLNQRRLAKQRLGKEGAKEKLPTPNKRKRKTKREQIATQKTKQAQKQDKAQIMLHNAIRIHMNEI